MSFLDPVDPQTLERMAKLAWRNNPRCIGRAQWDTLEVVDAQTLSTAEDIYEACLSHIQCSTNGGRIRSLLTAFAPTERGQRGIRIWNSQLIRYAGYRHHDGSVLGDPDQVEFTQHLMRLGWQAPVNRSAFDILPLAIETPAEGLRIFNLPQDAILEVPLTHPDFAWFGELGIRWPALPAVSNMSLVEGKRAYTAAPFSGYYMLTEIAARNLADRQRYNLLPIVAEKLGLDTQSRSNLWKDRALTELAVATLHSYREAGVSIIDHHSASEQFINWAEKEEAEGRDVPGDWSWLVPPMAASTMSVFFRGYSTLRPEPAFKYQKPAWQSAVTHTAPSCPFAGLRTS